MPLSRSALEPLLRLALVPGVGPGRLAALLHHFGSAERTLGARSTEIAALPGFGRDLAGRVAAAGSSVALERAGAAVATLERVGAVALTPDDLAYPAAFARIPDPPFLLFAVGRLDLLSSVGVGIVGTREPTPYGRRIAARLSGELCRAGYTIVSGMAKGIDAAAHAAALDAEGGTIGVLGHGIDQMYPAENRGLFERVRQGGVLISELPPGEEPRAGNFPRRNRLIAALSEGVLVVEMGARSGAQHTVSYALQQGKEVFAVPGPIGSPTSEGTNQMLKEGARLVTSVDDILEELRGVGIVEPPRPTVESRPEPSRPEPVVPSDLAPEEVRVLGALDSEARHVDDLIAATGMAPSQLLALLLQMEIRGLVQSLPGKRFGRAL